MTVHGDRKVAQVARTRWAQEADRIRLRGHARAGLTVADLLEDWLVTDHGWRPSTLSGNRSAAGAALVHERMIGRCSQGI